MAQTLEENILEFWGISQDLLSALRHPGQKSILAPQLKLTNMLGTTNSAHLNRNIQNTHDLAELLKDNHIREIRSTNSLTGTPQTEPDRATAQVPPHRSALAREEPRVRYKRGDEIILGVKNKAGNIADHRGFLGKQNMMTGQWYVMTPDWQGYASEKNFRHASKPTNDGDVA